MRCIILCALVLGCGGGDSSPDAAPAASPFLGSWKLIEFDGTASDGSIAWTFGPSDVAVTGGFSGTYTFDAGADPDQIVVSISGATPDPNLAIYRFDSDTRFTIKLQDGAPTRATTFDVEADYDVLVLDKL